MKVLIVEDEPLVGRNLQKAIEEVEPEAEVLGQLQSLEDTKAWFKEHPEPDLLFLDIQLSDGVSFDLFQTVEVNCPVIFTTAYNEYALQAFKVNSIDYLLKPIDQQELRQAFAKYKKLRSQPEIPLLRQQLNDLIKGLSSGQQKPAYKERLLVTYRDALIPIPVQQIACIHRDQLLFVTTHENKRYVANYGTLEQVEHLLDPHLFYRANRQHILHIDAIDSIHQHYTGKVTVKLKAPLTAEIDVSRERAADFKQWLN